MAAPAQRKSEGAPEYMVSYADMITIMMSFFVIMFALSQGRQEQEQAIESIGHRFGPKWRPWDASSKEGSKNGPATPVPPKQDAGGPRFGRANIPATGRLGGLGGSVFFGEFANDFDAEQAKRLERIAEECAGKPQKIEVLGHTSARPLPAGSPYRDHWDLAYARAHLVMQQLVARGIPAERIRIGVAANTEPANPRDLPTAGSLDSRVDIYLLDIYVTDFSPVFSKRAAQPEGEP